MKTIKRLKQMKQINKKKMKLEEEKNSSIDIKMLDLLCFQYT